MSSPLVSVIVTTNNSAHLIPRLLQSVRDQDYDRIELIVVDNKSTDGTAIVCEKFGAKVITQRCTVSESRLIGARESSGEFLLFADDDQVMPPNLLSSCSRLAKHGFEAIVIPERPATTNSLLMRIFSLERQLTELSVGGMPRFIKRTFYFAIGGHNPGLHFGEDFDLKRRIRPEPLQKVDSFIYHCEVNQLSKLLQKYVTYGKTLPRLANWQQIISHHLPDTLHAWMLLFIREPLPAVGVVLLKAIKILGLVLGLISSRIE